MMLAVISWKIMTFNKGSHIDLFLLACHYGKVKDSYIIKVGDGAGLAVRVSE
jgi:hypothetical protein